MDTYIIEYKHHWIYIILLLHIKIYSLNTLYIFYYYTRGYDSQEISESLFLRHRLEWWSFFMRENKNFFWLIESRSTAPYILESPVLFIPRLVDTIEIFLSCRPLFFTSFDSECPATGCNRPFKISRPFSKSLGSP